MREYKTGDLIKVASYEEPQVYLFSHIDTIYFISKRAYESDISLLPFISKAICRYVSPVQKVLRVKKASEIVKWLEDNGYWVEGSGHWYHKSRECFNVAMFRFCGKSPHEEWKWLPEWLEETYV